MTLAMASNEVSEISRLYLQELETPASASITDVKHLSSYNWIEAPNTTPTIAVPGSPALWLAQTVSRRLKKDSGLIYIAQNAARHPESPLEPLFRALYITNPSFDIRSTDVVTDRNNVRKLLSFIDPSSTRNGLEAFTMNIEISKNTALFCRDEAKTTEYIGPQAFKGYGHEFEKAYTSTKINGSTGHHRIISYQFSDLNFIVRHETDGYVDDIMRASSSKARNDIPDNLSSILGALSLSPASNSSGITPAGSKLIIKEEGQVVPLESTLEIKTRVAHRAIEIQDVSSQLWVSQTPKLVRAYHQKGTFQRPVVEDVTAIIKSWEERKQNELRKLAALIRKIISIVKEIGGSATLKYDVMGDKLVICKIERQEMLPRDLYSNWENAYDFKTETDVQNNDTQGLKIAQTRFDQDSPRASSIIMQYLLTNSPEFRQLAELRQKGWSNPEGDQYFKKQRHNADNADEKMSKIFYGMMKEIGREIHQSTCALAISKMGANKPTVLDMCMAPGGFLSTTLSINPGARAVGFSLPVSQGGHKALLPRDPNVTLKFLDITLLAADLGVADLPKDHPEARNMLSQQIDPGQLFDIILCDGQVLRTHVRAPYREKREARRLSVTQLAIGLQRVKVGGTMVVLLHKVEATDTVSLLYRFNKFSSVMLFKPTRHHAKRSSFYLVATDVQCNHSEAVLAVEAWQRQWKVATFGTDVEYEEELRKGWLDAEVLLGEFGEELVRLGRDVWGIQAKALEKAPFIKKDGVRVRMETIESPSSA